MIEKLARIKSVFFGIEDHGSMTFNIEFDFGGSGQGTGHYYVENETGILLMKEILKTLGAWEWKDLINKHVYVLYSDDAPYGMVAGVKSLPFDGNRAVVFRDYLDSLKKVKEEDDNA